MGEANSGTFYFQSGVFRQPRGIPSQKSGEGPPTVDLLRNHAASFLDFYYPQHAYVNVQNRISMFVIDDDGLSLGKLTDINQLTDGATVLIAVTGPPESHPSLLIPHNVTSHSYKVPTFCDYCGEMLYGLIRQGLKCHGCGQNFHRRCADKIPNTCAQSRIAPVGNSSSSSIVRSSISESSDTSMVSSGSMEKERRGSVSFAAAFGRPQWIDRAVLVAESEGKVHEHKFAIHNYMQPTVCGHCRKLLLGVFRQGFRCQVCRLNAHKSCRKHMKSVACVPRHSSTSENSLSIGRLTSDSEASLTPDEDAPNIPLQRICMSVRQSRKQIVPDILFSDWVIYRKEGDDAASVRYWQLDTRDLRLLNADPAKVQKGSPNECCMTINVTKILEIRQQDASGSDTGPLFTIKVSNEGKLLVGERATSPQSCSLSTYLSSTPPEEVFSRQATDGTPFADALARSLEDKRIQTLFKVLQNAHKPVVGAHHVNHNKPEGDDSKTLDTPDDKAPQSMSMVNLVDSSTDVVKPSESGGSVFADGEKGQGVSSSTSQPQVKMEQPASTEEDIKFQLEQTDIKERSSQEMSSVYQVFADEMLGSGQFGIVLAGEHRVTGVKVAIKVVEKASNQTPETNQQMKNEAKLLSSIDFPGVIRLFSMFESEKRLLIVMERMDSDMLDMILSSPDGRLGERVGRFLVFQILSALRYLHNKSIAHCDLKPENCLLTGSKDFPQVKLCDFGFARIIGERKFRKTVVGTPAYLAPEVLNNRGYNLSLDCWSVGVVIYVTLSGTFPFNEGEEITDQINSAEFLFPNNPWGTISAESQHLIINLLTLQPRKRYTTGKAMNHKWFANKQLWEDLRELETTVNNRYITHEAEDEFWERGGDLALERMESEDSGDENHTSSVRSESFLGVGMAV